MVPLRSGAPQPGVLLGLHRETEGLPTLPASSYILRSMATRSITSKLPVVLHPGEDGWIVAECPVIPGCISQGRDREDALRNIAEAIALCLDSQEEEGWALPSEYEVVDLPISA